MQATNAQSFKLDETNLLQSSFGIQFTPKRYFDQPDERKSVFNSRTLTNDRYELTDAWWDDGLYFQRYEMPFTSTAKNISIPFNLPL